MNNTIIDINNYKEKLENIILSKKIVYENSTKYFACTCMVSPMHVHVLFLEFNSVVHAS